ncbi:MAG: hypothetical protein K2J37_07955 [Ruminococcus sp.]|nr:hypothetical protein [Ruminococcus sp.]MDE6784646.1 hypothetical protein [Ruminococcus sp.]
MVSCIMGKIRNFWGNYTVNQNIILIIGFFLFFCSCLMWIYQKIRKTEWNTDKVRDKKKNKLIFWGSSVIMLLAWLPYFIYMFPGIMTSDSNWQLRQAIGIEPYSNHHPIAHTLVIKLFYSIGLFLFKGDVNLALATYSVCQAILLSMAFAYLIMTLYEFGFRKSVLIAVLLSYALPSYHALYSVTMWKDIWFGGIILVLSTTLWRIIVHSRTGAKKIRLSEFIMFFIFSVGMCLFRSNGLYAFVLLLLFMTVYFIRKKNFAIILNAAVALAVSLVVKGPVYNAMGVTPVETIESLSIPAQQIASVIRDDAKLTEEQTALLSEIVDISAVPDRYTPNISDSIKALVIEKDNQEYLTEHKFEFLKLWIDLGIKNPVSYIFAYAEQTFGYYYPDVQYWVYGIGIVGYGIDGLSHQPEVCPEFLRNFIDKCKDAYGKYPYLGLFWSIGMATWMILFSAGAVFLKKRKSDLLIFVPVIGVLFTLMIATPVFAEFRYAYSFFTTLPLLFTIPFCNEEKIRC